MRVLCAGRTWHSAGVPVRLDEPTTETCVRQGWGAVSGCGQTDTTQATNPLVPRPRRNDPKALLLGRDHPFAEALRGQRRGHTGITELGSDFRLCHLRRRHPCSTTAASRHSCVMGCCWPWSWHDKFSLRFVKLFWLQPEDSTGDGMNIPVALDLWGQGLAFSFTCLSSSDATGGCHGRRGRGQALVTGGGAWGLSATTSLHAVC